MLGNVQALRAIAALMVVVVHAYAVESTYLPGRPWTTPFHVLGTYGVDLFFVISGLVMLVSTATWFGERAAPRRFITSPCRAAAHVGLVHTCPQNTRLTDPDDSVLVTAGPASVDL